MSEWKPISTAPKNASSIQVKMKDGTIHKDAHWASDMSGAEQPPYEGWFIPSGGNCNYEGIKNPIKWQHLKQDKETK